MTNTRLQRFDFQHLRDFRQPITVNPVAFTPAAEPEEAVVPPSPVFSESDLENARDAAKKLGYAEGFEAGLGQANNEQSAVARDLAHTLSRIGDQLAGLTATYQALINEQSAELSQMVLMIARKVAGEALDARAADTIAALVARCLPVVFSKPKVTLEMTPLMLDRAEAMLREHFTQAGFEGDLVFRTLESLDESDIRLEWANGLAERNTAKLWQEIEALLQQTPLAPTLPALNQETQGDHHG